MISITLKPSEYATAVYLTSVREFANRNSGIVDRQMGSDDGFLIFVNGLVAEIAVCKYFNVCPDLSFEPRAGGADCLINGKRVDVKSTKPGQSCVYIPEWKAKSEIDRYVYCYVDFRTVEILGWFARKDIFREDNLEPSPRENVNHHVLYLKNLRTFE